ncbi:hypothetical protein PNOK_0010000 [Pyrrhoderma noxium]|uniref:Uncharacterized protein n=1 Tax=Pyrrhoderma noxium TaxID=2282107 RepID=A0A286UTV9_9AGAM|nr:hypothetical protein PNOK_0010000 [Pyrrhoderma noxium]
MESAFHALRSKSHALQVSRTRGDLKHSSRRGDSFLELISSSMNTRVSSNTDYSETMSSTVDNKCNDPEAVEGVRKDSRSYILMIPLAYLRGSFIPGKNTKHYI